MLVKFTLAATLALAASVILAAAVAAIVPGPASAAAVTVSARTAAVSADSVTVLWRLDLADGWHVYGPFRNDTGFPPEIRLDLPEGWSADPPRWPVPERHVTAGEILDHVYHDALVLPQVLRRADGAGTGEADTWELSARVSWLACKQICIPGDTTLTLSVPDRADPDAACELTAVLAVLPRPLAALAARIAITPDAVTIVAPGARRITAVPGPDGPFLVDLLGDGQVAGEELRLRLRPGTGSPGPLELLLLIDHDRSRRTTGTILVP